MAGAVLYAADVASLSAFYVAIAGFRVLHAVPEYVRLSIDAFELVLLSTADARAAGSPNNTPPAPRTQVAFKPVFVVADLAAARVVARNHGGRHDPVTDEWRFEQFTVCDGVDPEGNVLQLRQPIE